MKKTKYSEGDVFVIPLRTKGYGLGLIARKNKDILLGYFFDIKYDQIPLTFDSSILDEKKKIILIRQFGALGIKKGDWQIIGRVEVWERADWPVPKFFRHTSPLKPFLITYNDDLEPIAEENCIESQREFFPKDGIAGYGLIELILTDHFDSKL
jgi:hypothetical protein